MKKILTILLSILMMFTIIGTSIHAEEPEEGEEPITPVYVAEIVETEVQYETFEEAVVAATSGQTVKLLTDITTEAGLDLKKDLVIDGDSHSIDFQKLGFALWGYALTIKNANVTMNGVGSTPYTPEWNWMTICASKNASLTLNNTTMVMDAQGLDKHAIYFCSNNKLNLYDSSLFIKNYVQDALEWDGGDGGYNVNIVNSSFISDHNRAGFTGTFYATIDNSNVQVINSRGNGSNGTYFAIKNNSNVKFENNVNWGISAWRIDMTNNSKLTAANNGYSGIWTRVLNVDSTCTLDVEGNGNRSTGFTTNAGIFFQGNGTYTSLIEDGAKVTIKNNAGSGIYTKQTVCNLTIATDAVITNNGTGAVDANKHGATYGGGVYNIGTMVLSDKVQMYNNHADEAGDDIYNTGSLTFGETGAWKLDGEPDCFDIIDGWYDDSADSRWEAHEGPMHAVLVAPGTLSGVALKAAHGVAEFTVTKQWHDFDDEDGLRPESITIYLTKNGDIDESTEQELTSENWSHTFNDLEKYDGQGKLNEYGVYEVKVEGYETSYDKADDNSSVTIINSHMPVVTVCVTKTWDDDSNRDGLRPSEVLVDAYYMYNGEKVVADTATVSEGAQWTGSLTLDKYDASDAEIEYFVEEHEVTGYSATVDGDYKEGFEITNKHNPELTAVTVKKEWSDNENQDGIRGSFGVTLYMNGEALGDEVTVSERESEYTWNNLFKYYEGGKEVAYSVMETSVTEGYTSSIEEPEDAIDGLVTITNSHTPETISIPVVKQWNDKDDQDGIRPEGVVVILYADGQQRASTTLFERNQWSYIFENLDKFAKGVEIKYTLEEKAYEGYEATISFDAIKGFTVTNKHVPGTVSVTVNKVWDDNRNQDGLRGQYGITLYANGKAVGEEVMLDANKLTYTWNNLPKKSWGKTIVYTVVETTVPEGYTSSTDALAVEVVDGSATITNSHTPLVTSVTVNKVWNDGNNQDDLRGEYGITLFADGVKVGEEVLLDAGKTSYSWNGLPVYKNGNKINYTVEETTVPEGYESSVNGLTITNTHEVVKTEIEVTKQWQDADNKDSLRPESVEVVLVVDGKETDTKVTLSKENNWTAVFADLDVYNDGKEVTYTVVEIEVEGYETEIIADGNQITIINTHIIVPDTDPEEPTPTPVPDTGDVATFATAYGFMVASASGIVVLKALRKRYED